MRNSIIILSFAALLLTGCSNLSENNPKLKLTIEQKEYLLAEAKNQEQQEQGLMFVKYLPPNEGMIFYFDQKDYLKFWMKNTYIPLQILFIDGCKIVDIQEMTVETDPSHPLKNYSSAKKADKVIELNSNSISQKNIGTKIEQLCY